MTQDEAKALVGERAAALIQPGMRVGLGTGSTSVAFIRALGKRVQSEALRIRCVASSDSSEKLGRDLGMDVTTLAELPELDLYIDGADEVATLPATATQPAGFALIKGGGGALLREKIVASAAKRFICVVDESKLVPHLGKFPLPIEVIKMALPLVETKLRALGLQPHLRPAKDATGNPFLTDEGNYILDCSGSLLTDPAQTAAQIRAIVGVVEHGIFLHMASEVLVAGENGVRELHAGN